MLLTGIPTPRTWGVTTEFRLFQMRVNHFCSRVPLAGYLSWPSNVDSVERVILVEVLLVYRSVCITTCISFCLSVCLSVWSNYLFVLYASLCSPIYLCVYLYVYVYSYLTSTCVCICMYMYFPVPSMLCPAQCLVFRQHPGHPVCGLSWHTC